eukprot:366390-Chlamydomonas_euryale.AAC.38
MGLLAADSVRLAPAAAARCYSHVGLRHGASRFHPSRDARDGTAPHPAGMCGTGQRSIQPGCAGRDSAPSSRDVRDGTAPHPAALMQLAFGMFCVQSVSCAGTRTLPAVSRAMCA